MTHRFGVILSVSHNEVLTNIVTSDNVVPINSIIDAGRSTLRASGEVVFERTYSGTGVPSEVIQTFKTREDFDKWVAEINAARAALGMPSVG